MPSAAYIQSLMAKTRQKYGGEIRIGSTHYSMTTRSLEPGERQYLPEGLSNAADADLRVFCVSPTDFQDKQGAASWPAVGTPITWLGTTLLLIGVRPGDDVLGTTCMKLVFFAYKEPGTGASAPAAVAEEAEQDNIWEGRRLNG